MLKRHPVWAEVRSWRHQYWVQLTLEEIAKEINPAVIQGWINYYGKHNVKELKETLKQVDMKLVRWVRNKFKGYRMYKLKAIYRLGDIASANTDLFAHWKFGVRPTASPKTRYKRSSAE